MASLASSTSSWPPHMYVNQTEGNHFRCPAEGCGTQWSNVNQWPQLKMIEHWEKDNNSAHLSDLAKNQHLILRQLYKLSRCLNCREVFMIPSSTSADSRALFNHHKQKHEDEDEDEVEEDLSTVEGFITLFRKNPGGLRGSSSMRHWFDRTCELLYEHIICSLKHGNNPLWGRLEWFMGYNEIPEDKLRELFTAEDAKYFPIHPDEFLVYLEYDPNTSSLSPDEWEEVRKILQGLYREGKI